MDHPCQPKILTLEKVMHIICITVAPAKDGSSDDAVLSRIQRFLDSGYTLTPEAATEVAKHRDNAYSQIFSEAAE